MQSNSHVSKLVSLCANRYCVFDNEKRENKLQVRSLLDKIDEMVTANEGQYYTSDNMKTFERYIRTKDKSSSGQFVPVNPESSHHDDEKPKKMRFEEVLNFVKELIELIRSYAKGTRYHSFWPCVNVLKVCLCYVLLFPVIKKKIMIQYMWNISKYPFTVKLSITRKLLDAKRPVFIHFKNWRNLCNL